MSASEQRGAQPPSDVELTIDVQRLDVSLADGVVRAMNLVWTARWASRRRDPHRAVCRAGAQARRPGGYDAAIAACAAALGAVGSDVARMGSRGTPLPAVRNPVPGANEERDGAAGPRDGCSSTLAGGFVAGVAAAVVLSPDPVRHRPGRGRGRAAPVALARHRTRAVNSQFWSSLKRAALPLVGDRVYNPGFDAPVVWLAVVVLLVLSICVGVAFGLVARGRSRMATCMIAIPFGIGAWVIDLLVTDPSPATVIEAVPSALALAGTFLWFEGRLSRRRASPVPE